MSSPSSSAHARVEMKPCQKPSDLSQDAWKVVQQGIDEILYAPLDQLSRAPKPDEFESHVADVVASLPVVSTEYFVERRCSFLPSGNGLLAIKIESEDYLGGAHPMRWRRYRTFIKESGKSAALDEVFLESGKVQLVGLIEQAAKQDPASSHILKPSIGGFVTDVPPLTDEFAMTAEGILFAFQPYELAAYVDSPRDILIPWSELLLQVKPQFFAKVAAAKISIPAS